MMSKTLEQIFSNRTDSGLRNRVVAACWVHAGRVLGNVASPTVQRGWAMTALSSEAGSDQIFRSVLARDSDDVTDQEILKAVRKFVDELKDAEVV